MHNISAHPCMPCRNYILHTTFHTAPCKICLDDTANLTSETVRLKCLNQLSYILSDWPVVLIQILQIVSSTTNV